MSEWQEGDPDEYDDGPEEEPCDHDDPSMVDYDILTWRAACHRCGASWWAKRDEIDAEMKFQCEYAESVAKEYADLQSRK